MLGAAALVIAATILAQFWFRRYRRSRKQLLEAMARKEKLVALGHLAAGVAHEIRNPLSSIKGLAKYFAERTPPGGESHQLAQVMAKEADRLNRGGQRAAGAGPARPSKLPDSRYQRAYPPLIAVGKPGCAEPRDRAAIYSAT
ncbi:sensor protein of zinc sigma-54-dependent two-component system [Klebsiella pneumoniae]|uniref:histidine kinase n=1 Tax=Klebsiella pneumoniae TaxID=573 RepID=A0A2X3CZC4_KLEPN|nr:sensor protein of zinc sigma-54-dependent two-component system [Klebsiella pneumoniae]